MSIAYLASLYPYASDTYVRNEVQALRAMGWQISTFAVRRAPTSWLVDETLKAEADRTQYLLGRGCRRIILAVIWAMISRPLRLLSAMRLVWTTHAPGARNRVRQFAYICESALLARLLISQDIRHIHNHVAENSATVAMLAAKIAGATFSITVHGPGIFFHARAWGLETKVARSSFTACITDYCRSQCMVFTPPTHWHRLHVVRCGLTQDFLGRPPSRPPEEARLVCVGRLCAEKGHMLLLEAVRRLIDSGTSLELTVIGDGPCRQKLEQSCRDWGIEAHVNFTGWQSSGRVQEYLERARCLILPSFAEGLPIVIMESLAMGRPVIATQIAGIPELVKHGINGWLLPPGCIDSLTAAIREAISVPVDVLARMGAEGHHAVIERHDAAKEAARLSELFIRYAAPAPANRSISRAPGEAELRRPFKSVGAKT